MMFDFGMPVALATEAKAPAVPVSAFRRIRTARSRSDIFRGVTVIVSHGTPTASFRSYPRFLKERLPQDVRGRSVRIFVRIEGCGWIEDPSPERRIFGCASSSSQRIPRVRIIRSVPTWLWSYMPIFVRKTRPAKESSSALTIGTIERWVATRGSLRDDSLLRYAGRSQNAGARPQRRFSLAIHATAVRIVPMDGAGFKATLRALRRTQVDFAAELGVSLRAVHYWAKDGPPAEVSYLLDLLVVHERPFGSMLPGTTRDLEIPLAAELDRLLSIVGEDRGHEFMGVIERWLHRQRSCNQIGQSVTSDN